MSYRTHCDWCGAYLAHDADRAVMPVTIEHPRGKGTLDARWAEETKATRHFCAAPKDTDLDRHGRNRMGLTPDDAPDCCYERAIAAIKGRELSDPGMGMEWRLMPVVDTEASLKPAAKPSPKVPDPPKDLGQLVLFASREITAELHHIILTRLPTARKFVLPRAGITSLDQVAAMSDDELLALDGVGHGILRELRQAIRERRGIDGLTSRPGGLRADP